LSDQTILILKTGEAPPPVKGRYGDFEDWIASGLGRPLDSLEVASVYKGDPLPSVDSLSGVVITGSPAMVTERPDWSEASARWLAKVVESDSVPVLGLCYGHQLLAHALGGEVGPNPNGREMGTVDVTFHCEETNHRREKDGVAKLEGPAPIFEAGVFSSHMSHFESVLRPPVNAEILAHTALDPHSVLEFGPRQWGVQFHPEFDRKIMQGYVEARREVLVSEGLDPDAMIAEAVETHAITSLLARFVEWVEQG
jgi:GMP synthase (glutamine-hydrolysing)